MNKQREMLQLALDALDKYAFLSFIKESDWQDFKKVTGKLIDALIELEKTEQRLHCWDVNNPDYNAVDPQNMAEIFADNMHDDESGNFKVMVAVPLPDRIMRVELSGGEERKLSWEWVNEQAT